MGKVCKKYLFELSLGLWFKPFGFLDENFFWVFKTAFNVSSGRLSGKKKIFVNYSVFCLVSMFQQFFVDFWREKWSRFVETLIYLSKKTFWEKAEWCKRIQFTALRTMGKLWKFFGIKFGCTIETEFKDSGEKFWRNLSFFRIICFIYHFPTLSESFPLSSKKLCGTILKTTFRKPNKNFRGKNFFFGKCVVL